MAGLLNESITEQVLALPSIPKSLVKKSRKEAGLLRWLTEKIGSIEDCTLPALY